MAKNHHTFAKRQREIRKRRKAEEKRERRWRKSRPDLYPDPERVEETGVSEEAEETADIAETS